MLATFGWTDPVKRIKKQYSHARIERRRKAMRGEWYLLCIRTFAWRNCHRYFKINISSPTIKTGSLDRWFVLFSPDISLTSKLKHISKRELRHFYFTHISFSVIVPTNPLLTVLLAVGDVLNHASHFDEISLWHFGQWLIWFFNICQLYIQYIVS